MITEEQRAAFDRTGLIRLPGAVPTQAVAAMVDRIWEHLNRKYQITRDVPESWTVQRPSGLRAITTASEFDALGSAMITGAVDDLLGADRWRRPNRWARLLITFPDPDRSGWDLPATVWHNDFVPPRESDGPRAVQLFVILSELPAQGGGTLVLTGSHHLVERHTVATGEAPHPRPLRRALGEHPWLRELWRPDPRREDGEQRIRRYLTDGATVAGVPLRVVELTGRAGDAYLMHCDTFHCAAPNVLDRPRMMATKMLRPDHTSDR